MSTMTPEFKHFVEGLLWDAMGAYYMAADNEVEWYLTRAADLVERHHYAKFPPQEAEGVA